MDEQVKKDLYRLVEQSRDAVVCSVDGDGCPNAKAMYIAKHERLKTFWFSTNVSSARTQGWLKSPGASACIYLFDPEKIRGLMLTGRMQVCTDNETKLAFWKPGDEQYYPLGPADPDYCILRFTAEKGNLWAGQKYLFLADEM